MNPNRFYFTLTNRDMAEAFAAARRRLWKRFFHWRTALGLGIFIAMAIAASFWSDRLSASTPAAPVATTQPDSWADIFVPLIPWGIIFACVWFFIFRKLRAQHKNHRLVDRPHTLIVEPDKIIWTEPFSRLEYQWQAFYGFKETKNLFLLYLSDPKGAGILMFHVVPKRAFAVPDQIAEFKKLLEVNVQARVSRFPVIQHLAAIPVMEEKSHS